MDRAYRAAGAALPFLALALAAVLFFRDLLPLPTPARYLGSDFATYFYPVFRYVAEEVGAGRLPHWTPFAEAGYPLLADIEASVFYPPARLLSLLVGPPSYLGLELYAIAHYVVAGIGMFALGRQIGLGVLAASLSGLTFMSSGFLWAHASHLTIIQSTAWIPWLLAAHARALETCRPGWAVAAGVAFTLVVLGGHPQIALYAALSLAVLTLVVAARDPHASAAGAGWARLVVTVGVVALGLALAGPQVLPTLALAPSTSRWNPSAGFLRDDALPPEQLLTFLVPLAYFGTERFRSVDEFYAYVGIGALLLGAVALAVRRDAWCRGFAIMVILGLALALLPQLPGFTAVVRHVPVLGLFRASARATLLINLGAAGLCGLGLDAYREAFRSAHGRAALRPVVLGWRIAVAVALVAHAVILLDRVPGWAGLSPRLAEFYAHFLAMLLAHVVVLEAWRAGWLASQLGQLLTVALVVINLNHPHRALGWTLSPPDLAWQPTAIVRAVQAAPGHHRVWNEGWLRRRGPIFEANAGLADRLEVISHYTSLPLVRFNEFSLRDPWRQPSLLDVLNVRYLVLPDGETGPRGQHRYGPQRVEPGHERRYDLRGLLDGPIGVLTLVARPDPALPSVDAVSVSVTRGPRLEVCLGCPGAGSAVRASVTVQSLNLIARAVLAPRQPAREIRVSNRLSHAVMIQALKLDEVDLFSLGARYRQLDPNLWENASALPRAFLVEEVVVQPNTQRIMRALEGLDLRRTAVVERSPACREGLVPGDEPPPDVELVEYGPTVVRIRTRHPRPAFLVLTDAYYKEWRVHVDGRAAWMHHVNLLFRGVCVTAGEHEVDFRYRPKAFRQGVALALLAGAGATAAVLVAHRRRS